MWRWGEAGEWREVTVEKRNSIWLSSAASEWKLTKACGLLYTGKGFSVAF